MNKKLPKYGKTITIIPVRDKVEKISDDAKIQEVFEKIMKKYAPALKKLANN